MKIKVSKHKVNIHSMRFSVRNSNSATRAAAYLTEEKRYWNFCLLLFLAECVGNVHNVLITYSFWF